MRVWVSETGNEDYNFLIGIHELVEFYLCQREGISEQSVTEWDTAHLDAEDPGSDPKAPYYKQHRVALLVEDVLMRFMKINKKKYEKRLDEVCSG